MSDDIDQALSCSFCHDRFSDVIKLIPECGKSICGRCYEHLKEDTDQESNRYECYACHRMHALPPSGLPDNEPLLKDFARKVQSENFKTLEYLLREVKIQLEKLESFDSEECVRAHCERIELKVSETIEQARTHLDAIERKMMRQISEYRERCLENLSGKSFKQESLATETEIAKLAKEVGEFDTRWSNYFERVDVSGTESDIKDAISQTSQFMSVMKSMEEKMRMKAFNCETLTFYENSQFLNEWNHVGEIEIITKMTVQETPSFVLVGHIGTINQVLFLPYGKLASCSNDETIKIWNAENGNELFELREHTRIVYSIALLPNGHLASSSADKTIKIWDLAQRKEIRSIKAHSDDVVSLRVLKNGNLASYSQDDTIKIWDLNSKEDQPVSVIEGHGNTSTPLQLFGVLSNDCLMTCSRSADKEECILRIWNPNKPNPVKSVSTGFSDVLSLLVLSNDQVALGFKKSGTIKIIDPNDDFFSRTKEEAHSEEVASLAQLSNRNLISTGWDGIWTIKVWNFLDWSLLQTIDIDDSYGIGSLCISADHRLLASGSVDRRIKLWPISTKKNQLLLVKQK